MFTYSRQDTWTNDTSSEDSRKSRFYSLSGEFVTLCKYEGQSNFNYFRLHTTYCKKDIHLNPLNWKLHFDVLEKVQFLAKRAII